MTASCTTFFKKHFLLILPFLLGGFFVISAIHAFEATNTSPIAPICYPPVITSVEPASFTVPAEQVFMRITGSGFQCFSVDKGSTEVKFQGPIMSADQGGDAFVVFVVYSASSQTVSNSELLFTLPGQLISSSIFRPGKYSVWVTTPGGVSGTIPITIAQAPSTSPTTCPPLQCASPPSGCAYVLSQQDPCSCGKLICPTPTPYPSPTGKWQCAQGGVVSGMCFADYLTCTKQCVNQFVQSDIAASAIISSCIQTDCMPLAVIQLSPTPTPSPGISYCTVDRECSVGYRCEAVGTVAGSNMGGSPSACICSFGEQPGTCNSPINPTPLPCFITSQACPTLPSGCFYENRGDCSCGNLICTKPLPTPIPSVSVCGANGVTYPAYGYAKAVEVPIVYEGQCKTTELPVCSMEYAPVCGLNNKTYDNSCLAKLTGVAVAYQGVCKVLQTCTNAEGYASSCTPLSENIVSLEAPFISKDSTTLELSVKTPLSDTDAIWKTIYYYSNTQKKWIPKTLSGTAYQGSPAWLTNSAGGFFTMPTGDAIGGMAYVATWVYTYEGGKWIGPPCVAPPGSPLSNPLGCWRLETLKVQ